MDDYPENAFSYVGTIDEVVEKAKKVMNNSFQIDVITPIENINIGTSEYLRGSKFRWALWCSSKTCKFNHFYR